MISRRRHPKKEVADVLREARTAGLLVIEIHRGHRWGQVRCERCEVFRDIWSTPRSPGNHANRIHEFVRDHAHPSAPNR